MTIAHFEHLLKQEIGLDAASIGSSAVMRAVEARTRSCQVGDVEAYWAHLRDSSAELQALIEAVVVPETWFFRDREAFAVAVAAATTQWRRRGAAGAPIRLLSLPCATGEEPYTLAMSLLDAGFRPDQFRIDAVDISRRSLDHARSAVFGRNSFRGTELAFRERYFTQVGAAYRLSDEVRATVSFAQGNVFEPVAAAGSYDIVFCRNLLIYFDGSDQRRAIGALRGLLAPEGTIFVGHSEASLMMSEGFISTRVSLAFAFRKAENAAGAAPRPAGRREPTKAMRTLARVASRARPVPKSVAPVEALPCVSPASSSAPSPALLPASIADIRRLADKGDVPGALAMGEAFLRTETATPDALHLLGAICEAAGDAARAIAYYRKALYLDPAHREAIAHVALLLERQGDADNARRMRQRADRLDEASVR